VHFIDESSVVTAESRNETYLFKIQRNNRTDYSQLPTKCLIDSVVHIELHVYSQRTIAEQSVS